MVQGRSSATSDVAFWSDLGDNAFGSDCLQMFDRLPKEVLRQIFEFDGTFHEHYIGIMKELKAQLPHRIFQQNDFKRHPNMTSFHHKGFLCEIARWRGHWCGYVILSARPSDRFEWYPVHGGITLQVPLGNNKTKIGFDCAHIWDYSDDPDFPIRSPMRDDQRFRTFDYVRNQIESLIDLLIADQYQP